VQQHQLLQLQYHLQIAHQPLLDDRGHFRPCACICAKRDRLVALTFWQQPEQRSTHPYHRREHQDDLVPEHPNSGVCQFHLDVGGIRPQQGERWKDRPYRPHEFLRSSLRLGRQKQENRGLRRACDQPSRHWLHVPQFRNEVPGLKSPNRTIHNSVPLLRDRQNGLWKVPPVQLA